MKLVRIAAGVAAVGTVAVLAGCPLSGLAPGTNPSTAPFTGFPTGTLLDGRFQFQGKAPTQTLQANAKVPGTTTRLGQAATDAQGNFYWKSFTNTPSSASPLQIIWDDGGNAQTTDQNTMALWVSDPLTSPPASLATPQVTQDLYWAAAPSPAPNATVTPASGLISFTFTANPNLSNVQYQVSIFDTATSNSACWSSPLSANTTVQWDQTCGGTTATGGGTASNLTSFAWEIKFVENSGTFGGSNVYGSTKFITNTIG